MTDRIALTGAGLVLHDEHGKQLAAQTVVHGDGDVRIVTTGAWPIELVLSAAAAKHLHEVYGRAYRATLLPSDLTPRVPRRASELPATVSPMG